MKSHISNYLYVLAKDGILIYFIAPNNLKITAPKGMLTQLIQQEISTLKPDIIEWFQQQQAIDLTPYIGYYNERAAIREYEGGLMRSEAEYHARLETFSEFVKCEHPEIFNAFESIITNKEVII